MRFLAILAALTTTVTAALDTTPLEAWIRQQKNLRSLDATFTQERTLRSLKKPITTPGRLRFVRPNLMLWELGNPPKNLALATESSLTLVDLQKQRGKRLALDAPEARSFTLLTHQAFQDLNHFRQSFELIESRESNGIFQLTARPIDRSLRRHLPWIFLDIQISTSRLVALEFQLEDESRIRTIFTKLELNASIPPSIFQPDLSNIQMRD